MAEVMSCKSESRTATMRAKQGRMDATTIVTSKSKTLDDFSSTTPSS
jgi:hypothetical protein